MSSSHYERIGGSPAVTAVVDELYVRLTADDQVGHYFTDIDLPTQKRHMVLMLTKVLGGPDTYAAGRSRRPTSRSASPTPTTTASARPSSASSPRCGVPDDIQRDVGDVLGAVRPQVVSQA